MLEQARRVKRCHAEINGPFDNARISMRAFMGACHKEQLFLGCIPKAPQISDLIQLPLWVPSRKYNVQQKTACSPPWFSPPCVSRIPEKFPSALLQFYCPPCLPDNARNFFWKLYIDTDFYVVVSAVSVVFLLPLTVMEVSDPSTQVLMDKGNCYFRCASFGEKKKKSDCHSYAHGLMDSLRVFILDYLTAVLRFSSFRCDFGMNND